jgi:hypothetical protein
MKSKVLLAVVAACLTVPSGFAGTCGGHCVDGLFNGNPGSTSDSPEWGSPNVAKTFFAPSGISGNAWLYAEQGGQGSNTLYLMYDYLGGASQASFFDVFFEVGLDDYAVHILPGFGNFQVYEKPVGQSSGVVNGALDLSSAPWTLLLPGDPDLSLANFQAAIGFGLSPNSSTPHAMAEFALSVNRSTVPGQPNGLYSPDPAFWSASEKGPGLSIRPSTPESSR